MLAGVDGDKWLCGSCDILSDCAATKTASCSAWWQKGGEGTWAALKGQWGQDKILDNTNIYTHTLQNLRGARSHKGTAFCIAKHHGETPNLEGFCSSEQPG